MWAGDRLWVGDWGVTVGGMCRDGSLCVLVHWCLCLWNVYVCGGVCLGVSGCAIVALTSIGLPVSVGTPLCPWLRERAFVELGMSAPTGMTHLIPPDSPPSSRAA